MKQRDSIYNKDGFMKGMNYAGFWKDVFSSQGSDEAIKKLKSINCNCLAINLCWYQEGRDASSIFRHPQKTPSDESLIHLIKHAQRLGMKIMLKPMVDSTDETWRGLFNPFDLEEWFKSYEAFMMHYAELGEKFQVDLLCVGCEFPFVDNKNQAHWRAIIAKVRNVFRGKLTYAANFNRQNSYKNVDFWDALDYVGIDAYFSVASKKAPRLKKVIRGWNRRIKQIERWSRRSKHKKPILFTELGVCSVNGGCMEPWAYDSKDEPNWKEQSFYYEAFFRSFQNKKWFKGVYWWWWDNPSTNDYIRKGGRDYEVSYTPNGKDAEAVLKEYFS